MGGVRTDLEGRASLPGLFAAGEVACTGVHGANRLASNSLLEGLVFGARAGKAMRKTSAVDTTPAIAPPTDAAEASGSKEDAINQIRELMWNDVGVVRSGDSLRRAIQRLESLATAGESPADRRAFELANLHTVTLLIARSALARQESRGAHYRTDFPAHDDQRFRRHSVVSGNSIQFA